MEYFTRANVNPSGKPKIYFASHGKDFGYLNDTARHLLRQGDYAIYYEKDGDTAKTSLEDLGSMQLVVMILTKEMLSVSNDVISRVLRFAFTKRIPVLPLGIEPEVGGIFGEICDQLGLGRLDVFFPNSTDQTELKFETKLQEYLDKKLVSLELHDEILRNFHGRIFLSYRKKDRQIAMQVMNLIHEDEACRDYSIWYDEFLTAGESYDAEIQQAIDRSHVFLFLLTENMVKEDNYAIREELSRAKQLKRFIVLLDVRRTPGDLPREVAECETGLYLRDLSKLTMAFREVMGQPVFQDRASQLVHTYLLGMAYYKGIGRLPDQAYGCELIEYSAKNGLLKAMDEMIEISASDLGDYKTAVIYQKQIADIWGDRYRETKSAEAFEQWMEHLFRLGDYCDLNGDPQGMENVLELMATVLESVPNLEQYPKLVKRSIFMHDRLGLITQGKIENSSGKDRIDLVNKACWHFDVERSRAVTYSRYDQGMETQRYLYIPLLRVACLQYEWDLEPLNEVMGVYLSVLKGAQELYQRYPCADVRGDLFTCHKFLMETYHSLRNMELAMAHGERMLQYARENYLENRVHVYLYRYMIALEEFSNLQQEFGDLTEAARNLTKAVKAREHYIEIEEKRGGNAVGLVNTLITELLCLFDLRLSEKKLDECKIIVQQAYQYAVHYGLNEEASVMNPIAKRYAIINQLSS